MYNVLLVFCSWLESSIPSHGGSFSSVDHMRWSLSVVSSFHFPWSHGWPPWGLGNTLVRWFTKSAVFNMEQLIRAALFLLLFHFCYAIFLAKYGFNEKSQAHQWSRDLFLIYKTRRFMSFLPFQALGIRCIEKNKIKWAIFSCTGTRKLDSKKKTRKSFCVE